MTQSGIHVSTSSIISWSEKSLTRLLKILKSWNKYDRNPDEIQPGSWNKYYLDLRWRSAQDQRHKCQHQRKRYPGVNMYLSLKIRKKIFIKDCLTKNRRQELDVDETYDAKKNTIGLSGGTKSGLIYWGDIWNH